SASPGASRTCGRPWTRARASPSRYRRRWISLSSAPWSSTSLTSSFFLTIPSPPFPCTPPSPLQRHGSPYGGSDTARTRPNRVRRKASALPPSTGTGGADTPCKPGCRSRAPHSRCLQQATVDQLLPELLVLNHVIHHTFPCAFPTSLRQRVSHPPVSTSHVMLVGRDAE